jgi:hypothetical protein
VRREVPLNSVDQSGGGSSHAADHGTGAAPQGVPSFGCPTGAGWTFGELARGAVGCA